MQRKTIHGVCPYDGYQRGAFLKYGRLGDDVKRDPAYREAIAASRLEDVRSIVDEARCMNLFVLIKFFLRDLSSRNVIEFGAYKGGNSVFMASLLRRFYPEARVVALDTFKGAPESNPALEKLPQDFRSADLERTRRVAESLGLQNLEFVQGFVEETALGVCRRLGSIGLAHIDLVLHESSLFAQRVVWDFMAAGGYIVQDDALEPTCPGAGLAMQQWIHERGPCIEQIWPHIVFRSAVEG